MPKEDAAAPRLPTNKFEDFGWSDFVAFLKHHNPVMPIFFTLLAFLILNSWMTVQVEKTKIVEQAGLKSFECANLYAQPRLAEQIKACEAQAYLDSAYVALTLRALIFVLALFLAVFLISTWTDIFRPQPTVWDNLGRAVMMGGCGFFLIMCLRIFITPNILTLENDLALALGASKIHYAPAVDIIAPGVVIGEGLFILTFIILYRKAILGLPTILRSWCLKLCTPRHNKKKKKRAVKPPIVH